MSKGKKTAPEVIYQVMVSYAITKNNMETSRQLGIPESTVRKIVEDNKDKDEFKKLCEQKQDEFAEKTTRIIDKLLERLENEIYNEDKDIPINHITTAIGTLYDKRALSKGESTQNIGFSSNDISIDKLASISGFKKDESK